MAVRMIIPVVALFIVQGCSESDSENIKTSGMWVEINGTATSSSNIDVEAEFKTGSSAGNDYINLTGNDYADATVDSTTRMLTKEESIVGEITYETTFQNLNSTSAKDVTVALHRDDEPDYPSSMTVPTAFSITALTPVIPMILATMIQ